MSGEWKTPHSTGTEDIIRPERELEDAPRAEARHETNRLSQSHTAPTINLARRLNNNRPAARVDVNFNRFQAVSRWM